MPNKIHRVGQSVSQPDSENETILESKKKLKYSGHLCEVNHGFEPELNVNTFQPDENA